MCSKHNFFSIYFYKVKRIVKQILRPLWLKYFGLKSVCSSYHMVSFSEIYIFIYYSTLANRMLDIEHNVGQPISH